MTYNENIQRLKQGSTYNTSLANKYETEAANQRGKQGIEDARYIAKELGHLSTHLKEWRKRDILEKVEQGKLERQKDETANAEKAAQLTQEIQSAQDQDTEYFQQAKAELLRLSGPDAYPEADRLAKLSPWAQVGYVQERIRSIGVSFPDKLAYMMQNSQQAITAQGLTFSPAELRENNISGLAPKEIAVHAMAEQLKREMGLYNYSPEMLAMSGINDVITQAKEKMISKYRERYNIDASMQTRAQAGLEWKRGPRDGAALYRLLTVFGATVNDKNQILGNTGAWAEVMKILTNEGIGSQKRSLYAKEIGDLVMPDALADKLGVPRGKTFGEQWPQRIDALEGMIKKGFKEAVNAERDYLKSEQTHVGNLFNKEAREGKVYGKRLEYWKEISLQLGGELDGRIKNYFTASQISEDKDFEAIQDHIDINGYITNDELDGYHPSAAAKYREQANRWENAHKKKHNVDGKIKGALNESWTEAGFKQKEKPLVWENALAKATQDYWKKFNQLVGMGFDADTATKFALESPAGGIPHPETGEMMLADFEGVVSEIKANGANSKYTRDSEDDIAKTNQALIRFAQIDIAKKEMQTKEGIDPRTYVLGGDYGTKQIQSIIEKIEQYAPLGVQGEFPWRAIRESEGAFLYYQGIARGKRGYNTLGIIDAQLKAAGHPGIWPEQGQVTNDESGATDEVVNVTAQTDYGGSMVAYNNLITGVSDIEYRQNGGTSPWNTSDNLMEVLV